MHGYFARLIDAFRPAEGPPPRDAAGVLSLVPCGRVAGLASRP